MYGAWGGKEKERVKEKKGVLLSAQTEKVSSLKKKTFSVEVSGGRRET